ncbi:MAG TPA: ubiquinol-cytochrome C chaperone family protein [Sphingomonadaceae bacterium]|nr:ubiquinol-cytochrome C chaperone family protein [Sphingomonadaceae bacterium]
MTFLSRLFGNSADPREELRGLWHRIVEVARERQWYSELGVADTVEGRFEMIVAVLSLVLIRMESDESLTRTSVLLTELFVEDMDGQLRQRGIGDLVMGKHIGRLVSALGGRLGAYRAALAQPGNRALAAAVARNFDLPESKEGADLAQALRDRSGRLARIANDDLLAGKF